MTPLPSRRQAILGAAAAALPWPRAARAGDGRTAPALFGLHMDLTWEGSPRARLEAVARAKALGAEVSRNSLLWHLVEARRGSRDWSRVDAVVEDLALARIVPLFVAYGSPPWANGATPDDEAYLKVPQEERAFGLWTERYADFLGEAARRYRGRVRRWELWNEENEHWFWRPRPDVDRYAQWFRAASRAIANADPDAEIALGGLVGLTHTGRIDMTGLAFLEALYDRGVRPTAVAVHPYAMSQQTPETRLPHQNNFVDVELVRRLMVERGAGDRPIWITEWGWSAAKVPEELQAGYVAQSLEMIEGWPYVALATYFIDRDRGTRYREGLYAANGRMRPAGAAFRDFIAEIRPQARR